MSAKEDIEEITSENSVYSPMSSSRCRLVFDRLCAFASPWKTRRAPRGRRIFHRDVEKEEFQYASTQCLSSYYSVFVVRLAIMVGQYTLHT